LDFPYVGQLFRLTRERIDLPGGKPELEVLYGLTSLSSQQAGARKLLGLSRTQWANREPPPLGAGSGLG